MLARICALLLVVGCVAGADPRTIRARQQDSIVVSAASSTTSAPSSTTSTSGPSGGGSGAEETSGASAPDGECDPDNIGFEIITGYVFSAPEDLLDSLPGTLMLTDCLEACQANDSCQAVNYETGLCVLFSSNGDKLPGKSSPAHGLHHRDALTANSSSRVISPLIRKLHTFTTSLYDFHAHQPKLLSLNIRNKHAISGSSFAPLINVFIQTSVLTRKKKKYKPFPLDYPITNYRLPT